MNMKNFFAPSAWRLGGAARRAATALLLCVLTMTVQTAWAQSGNWSDHKASAFSTINESVKTISITTEAELALLAYNTCNGTDYSGYTITLTKDLNMRAHYWDKSIGTELSYYSGNNSFRGTFNGANKTISGIYISSGSYKGLFGFVGMNEKPGTIQNVTLASSTITGDDNVGGIVGCLLYGTVSNCHVLSSVSILASGDGSNNHGGIVGQTYPNKNVSSATIENCTSAASVTNNGHNNCSSYGGIVGYNYYYSDTYFSKVTGCFYYGTAVSASSEAGAIVGLNYKADGTGISNCYYNYPSTISGIGYGNKDIGTTRVYTVTCTTSGLSTTGTATYTHNGTHYFAAGATATVTLGIANKGITSLSATSGTISDVSIAPDGQSATFTVGSSDVTVSATTDWTDEGVTYVDANGTTQTVHGVTEINSTNKPTTLNGWYVVTEDVSYNDGVQVYGGDAHLILADGVTMSITKHNRAAFLCNEGLYIYGQTAGSGTLNVTSDTGALTCSNNRKTITVNGGHVNTYNCEGGFNLSKDFVVNGGVINAIGSKVGIQIYEGTITLGLRNPSDYIHASSYSGTVNIKSGQTLYDESGNAYTGNGVTIPANATLRTYSPDDFAETGTNEYTIKTATGWGVFCDLLAAADGKAFFSGKTVKLANDISVTRMASADYHDFCGTFDGGGHTLTFNATATDNYLAPFRNVLGNSSSDHAVIHDLNVVTNITAADYRHTAGLIAEVWGYVDVINCNVTANITATKGTQTELYPAGLASQVVSGAQLTVSGCTVGGTIATDGKYAGGIIGIVQGSASIVNSVCGVTINSSTAGDGTHGGLVAVSYPGSTNIEGCVFNGKLLTVGTTDTKNCGGFVGWRNTGSVTISNSLYAPADLGNGETEVKFVEAESYPNATFVRNGVSSITNSYYTRTLGTAQGLAAHTIAAGENVSVAHAGVATTYDVSHITAYKATAQGSTFIPGLLYNNNVLYAGSGDAVSLTLTNTPPTGYTLDSYTASPDGATLSGEANPYSLTMPDANVTIGATFSFLSIAYIDENGQQQFCTEYTVLSEDFHSFLYAGQWYVVKDDIEYYDNFETWGNGAANIILVDGKTCSIFAGYDFRAIKGNVNIYGQSLGTGTLNLTGGDELIDPDGNSYSQSAIFGNIAVYGGIVTANSGEYQELGSDPAILGNVVCRRGKLTANIGDYAIMGNTVDFSGGELTANGIIHSDVTINWTNSSDRFYANSLSNSVTISNGKAFCYTNNTGLHILGPGPDNGDYILSAEEKAAIAGKTLYPAVAVTLADGITAVSGIITTGDNKYAKVGETVTVSVTAPEGYTLGGITVTPAATVTDLGSGSYSFTVPAANVSVSAQFDALGSSVAYIDENGVVRYKQPGEYTVLTGTETRLGSYDTTTWYVVNSDISYTGTVTLGGNVNIILADDAQLNLGTSQSRLSSNCIIAPDGKYSLTIYGQANQSGHLSAYNSSSSTAVYVKSYTQHGGNVTIDATGSTSLWTHDNGNFTLSRGNLTVNSSSTAIRVDPSRSFYMSGGSLTVTSSGGNAIYSNRIHFTGGDFTAIATNDHKGISGHIDELSWTNLTDHFYVSSITGSINIASGKTFYDENGNTYTNSNANTGNIAGKNLRPYDCRLTLYDTANNSTAIASANGKIFNVTMSGRKLWKDGAWNTLVLPFSIANIEADGCPLKGATVRELNDASITGTTLTLNFKNATKAIAAGVPYIVKWADGTAGQYTQDPVFQGVTIDATDHSYDNQAGGDTNVRFIGTYDQKTVNTEDQSILFLGAANTLYYPSGLNGGVTIGACRAYFKIGSGDALARQLTAFNFGFGDETGIGHTEITERAGAWYTLDGVKLNGKPTCKGLYIHGGKKVVIK